MASVFVQWLWFKREVCVWEKQVLHEGFVQDWCNYLPQYFFHTWCLLNWMKHILSSGFKLVFRALTAPITSMIGVVLEDSESRWCVSVTPPPPKKNKIPISVLRDFACQAVVLVYPTHGNSSQTLSAATWQEHVYRLTLACYCIGQKIFSLLRRLTQGEPLIRTAEKKSSVASGWINCTNLWR